MLNRALLVLLESNETVKISISYSSKVEEETDLLVLTASFVLPEYGDSSRSYSAHVVRSIPILNTDIAITDDVIWNLTKDAFNPDYIKYILTSHIEDYYKSNIVSWTDLTL